MNNLDPLLSAQRLADYLEVPLATIYAWRHRHQGPPGLRIGRHLRFRRTDVDAWIEDRIDDTRHYQTAQSEH
jgi:excisionase family DNA binding protein